ncbi:hypothetical protein [Agarivorans litoreus]|uniref:hypothetical protein n=1 Tax=Agarivorans litoreus TaxID=1510455 RepID=UPI001C7DEB1F|nr:hypothetical protein [Agarivorans litoreus]
MRKMDKKRDKDIVAALTEVCEDAKQRCEGFAWISHSVNFQRFPDSLLVSCAYASQSLLSEASESGEQQELTQQVVAALANKGIVILKPQRQIRFISE